MSDYNRYMGFSLVAIIAGIITLAAASMMSYDTSASTGTLLPEGDVVVPSIEYIEFQPMHINISPVASTSGLNN